MCLRRYVTWASGETFDRTLNYFPRTARIKCFDQRLSLAEGLMLRRDAAGLKKPPQTDMPEWVRPPFIASISLTKALGRFQKFAPLFFHKTLGRLRHMRQSRTGLRNIAPGSDAST